MVDCLNNSLYIFCEGMKGVIIAESIACQWSRRTVDMYRVPRELHGVLPGENESCRKGCFGLRTQHCAGFGDILRPAFIIFSRSMLGWKAVYYLCAASYTLRKDKAVLVLTAGHWLLRSHNVN